MSCFVYGTLMFPEVLMALINRVPRHEPAAIHGFSRHRIRGQVFPGTVRSAGAAASVQGLVLFELQPRELEMLDEFEGEEYAKEPVTATLLRQPGSSGSGGAGGDADAAEAGGSSGGGGEAAAATVDTFVYVWQDALRGYLYGEWDPQHFRDTELERYVDMCGRFAADVRQQRGWKGAFEAGAAPPAEDGSAAAGAGSGAAAADGQA